MNEVLKLSTKSVGEMLKSAREQRGLTHADVYKLIKVHPKYLEALEQNNYMAFSNAVHAKGFLKVYSALLELNVDEVLAFFRRECDEKLFRKARTMKPLETPKLIITPSALIFTSVIILVLLFFGYLFYQYKSYTGAPELVIDNPKENLNTNLEKLEVIGKTDRDTSVFLNGQKLRINPDGSFVTVVDLITGLNSLSFVAVNKIGKETKAIRTIIVNKDQSTVLPATTERLNLEIKATKSATTVYVTVDSSKQFQLTFLQGTSKLFEASQSITLKAINAGAITIKVNNKDLGIFGENGESKEQEFKSNIDH